MFNHGRICRGMFYQIENSDLWFQPSVFVSVYETLRSLQNDQIKSKEHESKLEILANLVLTFPLEFLHH